MATQAEIEAVAEALWIDASKDRFGKWPLVTGEFKDAWRKSAKAALEAAERARWQPIETEPSDDSPILLSDGETVWPGKAHKDGSLRLPSRSACKYWMPRPPLPSPPESK